MNPVLPEFWGPTIRALKRILSDSIYLTLNALQLPVRDVHLCVGDGVDKAVHLFSRGRFPIDFKVHAILGVNQVDSAAGKRMVFHRT